LSTVHQSQYIDDDTERHTDFVSSIDESLCYQDRGDAANPPTRANFAKGFFLPRDAYATQTHSAVYAMATRLSV